MSDNKIEKFPGGLKTGEEKKIAGKVTPEERDEIRILFERKNGLAELFRTFAGMTHEELEASPLYNKVVNDMGATATKFQQWWEEKSRKYNWENVQGLRWEIDFETCTVFLRKP